VKNSFSAEYGRGKAVMLATIKSGTNGVGYEFLRYDALDARKTFLRRKRHTDKTSSAPPRADGLSRTRCSCS